MPNEQVNSGTADTASVWVSPSRTRSTASIEVVTDMLG